MTRKPDYSFIVLSSGWVLQEAWTRDKPDDTCQAYLDLYADDAARRVKTVVGRRLFPASWRKHWTTQEWEQYADMRSIDSFLDWAWFDISKIAR